MGIDIEGYIEIYSCESSNESINSWQGIVDISPLILCADNDTDKIFGISKNRNCSNPLASNRGLPDSLSQVVTSAINRWREFEKEEANFSFDELYGFTYASWQELENQQIDKHLEGNQWQVIFEIMKALAKKFQPQNVRIVLWAYW